MSDSGLKRMPRRELRALVERVVADCKKIVEDYLAKWEPLNSAWKTVEGAAYLRLSTDEQVVVEKGSLEQQIYMAITESIDRSKKANKNYRLVKFYIEPGITGRSDKRPEFIAMQRAINQSLYDFVIFKELTRVTRESKTWKTFFELCISRNCEICIKGFPFNPNDPSQIFLLDIMAAVAEYESNLTSKRIRENTFSALVNTGKFNSTRSFLGLDQLVINGAPKIGLYSANPDELKIVEWIMREFIAVPEYKYILELLQKKNITNKNGDPFTRNTLRNLLTNRRYIGEWEVNAKNRDKDQERLMPYERYSLVELPHGCVINRDLWDRVQIAVCQTAGNMIGSKAKIRVYPLSGLLEFSDGSDFVGNGAWSSTSKTRHNYYVNQKNKIRIPCEIIEEELVSALNDIRQKSHKIQAALDKHHADRADGCKVVDLQIKKIERELELLVQQREKVDHRLDFLLETGDSENAKLFQNEYAEKVRKIADQTKQLKNALVHWDQERKRLKDKPENIGEASYLANDAITSLKQGEMKKLKKLLPKIFQRVVIGATDHKGCRKISFQLVNKNDRYQSHTKKPSSSDTLEDGFCIGDVLVEVSGVEPLTFAMPLQRSTN